MDGANIEIRNTIGEENMFIFGVLAEQVEEKRKAVREGTCVWPKSLKETIKLVEDGLFNPASSWQFLGTFGEFPEYKRLLDTISHNNDYYLIAEDWEDYLRAQAEVDKVGSI